MKTELHPDYVDCHVTCSCGNQFTTRATVPELHVDLCSACHPFYTGKQKLVDTGGRVERFQKRYERAREEAERTGEGKEDKKEKKRRKRTAQAPRRKPPVATKGGPRPKFEPKGKGDKGDKAEKGEKAEKAEKPDEGEQGEQGEQSEQGEQES